jgi:DNA-binding CsgD family transcriptional regulator
MAPAGTWPFAGRADELREIEERLHRRRSVLLAGPAGVGKTRLAAEAARTAEGLHVVTLVASRPAASLPLAALAPLVDEDLGEGGLAAARRAVRDRSADGPLLVQLDDAQWLDDASAVLLHQLVAAHEITLLATLRSGTDAPEPVVALWKDGLVDRIDVEALDREATRHLLESATGALVDPATAARVFERTEGNALFVRELVDEAYRRGLTQFADGVWSLSAMPPSTGRVQELLAGRLAELTEDQREALELVVLGEPIAMASLLEVVPARSLEALESEGLLRVASDEGGDLVRPAHPLHADAVRAGLPELRRRRLLGTLADLVQREGGARQALRLVLLHLEAGATDIDPTLLREAAIEARFGYEGETAERVARAAYAADPTFEAAQVLADVLGERGAHDEQETVLRAAEPLVVDDEQRAVVAMMLAVSRFWGKGDAPSAEAALLGAEDAVQDEGWWWEVRGLRATIASQSGDHRRALELLQDRPDRMPSARAEAQVALALAFALPGVGRGEEGIRLIDEATASRSRIGPQLSLYQVGLLAAARSMALVGLGRLQEAQEVAELGHAVAVDVGDPSGQAFFASTLGWVEVNQGRLLSAMRHYREAAAVFLRGGSRGPARWALGGLLLAAAWARDREAAEEAARALDTAGPHPAGLFDVAIGRALGWARVAAADPEAGRAEIVSAAQLAAGRGLPPEEASCLHDLARLGNVESAERLAELAESCDGDLVATMASHAAGLRSRDPDALAAASEAFEGMGFVLKAAEAAMGASEAAAAGGDQRRATRLGTRAAELSARCETPSTPALAKASGPVPLTNREREIALLAAEGLASRVIAERLFLSTRTVDNHLARIYAKLGVSGRSALAEALGT